MCHIPAFCVWQVPAAKDFLVRADPLKHVAPVRKSSVQHKLCDMLINILGANVTADLPRCASPSMQHSKLPVRWASSATESMRLL